LEIKFFPIEAVEMSMVLKLYAFKNKKVVVKLIPKINLLFKFKMTIKI